MSVCLQTDSILEDEEEQEDNEAKFLLDEGGSQSRIRFAKVRGWIYMQHLVSESAEYMWMFSFGLFLVVLCPDSLRMLAVYLLCTEALTMACGSIVYQWIQTQGSLKAIYICLLTQRICSTGCAAITYVALQTNSDYRLLVASLVVLSLPVGVVGKARARSQHTVWMKGACSNDSQLEKELKMTLQTLSQVACSIVPAVSGLVMSYWSLKAGAILLCSCSMLFLFIELFLAHKVSDLLVTVTVLATRERKGVMGRLTSQSSSIGHMYRSNFVNNVISMATAIVRKQRDDFAVYFKHKSSLTSLALATLFATVFIYDSVAIGYMYRGNINEAVLGILFAIVTIATLTGTRTYTYMRTRRHESPSCTGTVGICLICTASVVTFGSLWLPGAPFDTDWSSDMNATVVTRSHISIVNGDATRIVSLPPTEMTSSFVDEVSGQGVQRVSPLVYVYIACIIMVAYGLQILRLSVNEIFLDDMCPSDHVTSEEKQTLIQHMAVILKLAVVCVFSKSEHFGVMTIVSLIVVVCGTVIFLGYYKMYKTEIFRDNANRLMIVPGKYGTSL